MRSKLKKILVADGSPDMHSLFQVALEDVGGFEVQYCSSGIDAIYSVDEFNPDLFILDLACPDMDGMTILSELQKQEKFQAAPIIFTTIHPRGEMKHLVQGRVLDVLTKPFDPMILADNVQRLWDKK